MKVSWLNMLVYILVMVNLTSDDHHQYADDMKIIILKRNIVVYFPRSKQRNHFGIQPNPLACRLWMKSRSAVSVTAVVSG